MPAVNVVFYRERDGSVPVRDWLVEAARRDERVAAKCRVWLGQLAENGHSLRRPGADYLRDDISELRIRYGSVNYRILYVFHGRTVAVLAHGLTKEREVSGKEIDIAIARKIAYLSDPELHTAEMEMDDEAEDN